MPEFEELFGELLRTKPELSGNRLREMIEEKKRTVGAGFLTDQGALYLIAGELGVPLQTVSESDMRIKDLYVGANELTLNARVLSIYPVSNYTKKKDGSTGRYRRLTLFDGAESVKLTMWDDQVDEMEKLGLSMDTPLKITGAYVKQGIDGKPTISLGNRGRLEVLSDRNIVEKLPLLADVVERPKAITSDRQFVAVECLVKAESRYSEFVRSDGSPGSLVQFTGSSGPGAEFRVVIWSPVTRPELKQGQRVMVTNLRSRKGSLGDYELHGDAGSSIILGERKEPIELRVAHVSDSGTGKMVLTLDSQMRVRAVKLRKGLIVPIKGDLVQVSADSEASGVLVCDSRESIVITKDGKLGDLPHLQTKLRDAREGTSIMTEVIALNRGAAREVRANDGSVVRLGELTVGDDSAEMRLVGWRDRADVLGEIQPGERLRLVGVSVVPGRTSGRSLELSSFSSVERLRTQA